MIFALWDYWNYKNRRGRFSDQQNNEFAIAFTDVIPEDTMKQLLPSDMVMTQRMDSFLSWALMYYASSNIDHSGIYVGDGNVLHMTLEGTKLHTLRSVTKGARVLVLRMGPYEVKKFNIEMAEAKKNIDTGPKFWSILPQKLQLILGGLNIIHGKYPDRFKLKFYFEFIFSLIVISAILYLTTGYITSLLIPIISVGFLIYIALGNIVRAFKRQPMKIMSYPDLALRAFFKGGGLFFTKLGPLVVSDLGLLPLGVFVGIARQSANDSANNDFEEAREFFRYLIEGWDLDEPSQEAEDQNRNEEDDKKI